MLILWNQRRIILSQSVLPLLILSWRKEWTGNLAGISSTSLITIKVDLRKTSQTSSPPQLKLPMLWMLLPDSWKEINLLKAQLMLRQFKKTSRMSRNRSHSLSDSLSTTTEIFISHCTQYLRLIMISQKVIKVEIWKQFQTKGDLEYWIFIPYGTLSYMISQDIKRW